MVKGHQLCRLALLANIRLGWKQYDKPEHLSLHAFFTLPTFLAKSRSMLVKGAPLMQASIASKY